MPPKQDVQKFKRRQKVVAAKDLIGVPAGTKGRVRVINGLSWIRYWVHFENGAEVGQLSNDDLLPLEEWEARADARRAAERNAAAEERRAKYLAGQNATP